MLLICNFDLHAKLMEIANLAKTRKIIPNFFVEEIHALYIVAFGMSFLSAYAYANIFVL